MAKNTSYTARLDLATRPQDNFFGYVNHTWLAENPIPPSESVWGSFFMRRDQAWKNMRHIYELLQEDTDSPQGTIEQQARDFYYTGMHADDFKDAHMRLITKRLQAIDTIASRADLSRMLGELHRQGVAALWNVTLDADDKNSAVHIVRFRQGGLTLPDRDYYIEDNEKMRSIRAAYEAHLQKVYGFFPQLGPNAEAFVRTIVDFETKLAQISRATPALRDVEANYNKMPYLSVQKDYDAIDWPAYAKTLNWAADDKITIDQPEFFAFANAQFTAFPLGSWKMYLKWQFLSEFYGQISEELATLKFEFFGKILFGTQKMMPEWKRVTLRIDAAMGEGVGKLYVAKHFSEDAKKEVLQLVERLRTTYKQRIDALEWMSQPTKQYAHKKLDAIKVLIGYPDTWRDFTPLKVGRTSYIENIIAGNEFENDYALSKLHQPTSRDEWFMHPQTVNAYHDPNRLVICFPAAVLQPPFFDPSAPLAANMAGIGAIIGHELTHGFDDQGCRFDAEGNVHTWQTEEERAAFEERAQIIIDQANHFEALPGLNLRGKLVIGESIADLGGIEIAYDAMKRAEADGVDAAGTTGLTPDELFFINYAICECSHSREEWQRQLVLTDPHPVSIFRVNGTLQHVDSFYQTFGVTEKDKLYRAPNKRAKIW